jgi:hypothetical protein
MKILMTAIAFVIAAPAAAQTAPAQQHQGHDQHQQHRQAPAQPGQPPNAQHSQHQGSGADGDCCADRNGNGRMDCCENMAQAGDRRSCCAEHPPASAPAAQPQSH